MRRDLTSAVYLASSWFWCIGGFFPVLLYLEFGPVSLGWFLLFNVTGATLFGWIWTEAGRRAFLRRLGPWGQRFSALVAGYHLVFAGWISLMLDDPRPLIGVLLVAALCVALHRHIHRVALIVLGLCLALALVILSTPAPPAPPLAPRQPFVHQILPLAFGFALAPWCDLTFHRAFAEAARPRRAFTIGFGGLFTALLGVVFLGLDAFAGLMQAGALAQPAVAAAATLLVVQTGFTVAAHLIELGQPRTQPRTLPLALGGGVVCALLLLHWAAGLLSPALVQQVGALVYRSFVFAVGVVFPVIALFGPTRHAAWTLAALTPCYALGFLIGGAFAPCLSLAMVLLAAFFRARPATTSALSRPPQAGKGSLMTRHPDPRRAYWLVGFLPPLVAPVLLGCLALGLAPWAVAVAPVVLLFGIAPLADHLIGRDTRNVPPEAVAALEADPFYRRLMHGIVPSYGLGVLAATALATSGRLDPLQWVIFTIGIAFVHSLLVLVAHELGHARAQIDRRMASLALSLLGYGHFGVEHNVGHHKKVATPEDPASARYNESIYRFALREMPGVLLGALEKERARLHRRGLGWWSPRNALLRSWALSALIAGGLTAVFGPMALLFFALHSLVAWFSITMANYTAHYGLLREMQGGRREPCQPKHSWSSSFLFSNLLFFNLQRHSDHHANAQRPFQTLSHIEGTPQLPAGIPGLFCMMLVPPVWFRIMNPRLLAATGYQPARINLSDQTDVDSVLAARPGAA